MCTQDITLCFMLLVRMQVGSSPGAGVCVWLQRDKNRARLLCTLYWLHLQVGPAPGEDASAAADADKKRREELEKAKKANLFQYEITTYTSNIK